MCHRKWATSLYLRTFLVLTTKTWLLFAIECPDNLSQLLETLNADIWSAQNLHYEARVFVNDLSQNPDVTSESTLTLSLKENNGSPDAINCSFQFPLDNRPVKELSNIGVTAEDGLRGVSGSLFYKSKKPHPLWINNSLFPVERGSLSAIKATYSVSVAVPVQNNYTVLSNMPLEKVEPLPNKPGWAWNHFGKTPPLWLDQILVMVMDGKNLRAVQYKDALSNRTVSVYWNSSDVYSPYFGVDILCTCQMMARLLSHFETSFNESIPLAKVDVMVSRDKQVIQALTYDAKHTGFFHSSGRTCRKSGPAHFLETWEWFDSLMNQWFGYISKSDSSLYPYLKTQLVDRFLREAAPLAPEDTINVDKRGETFPDSAITMLESVLTKSVFKHGLYDNFMGKLKLKESTLNIEDLPLVLQQSVETFNKTHLLPPGVTVSHLLQNWMNSNTTAGLPRILVTQQEANTSIIAVFQETFDGYWRWLPLKIMTDTQSILKWVPPAPEAVTLEVTEMGEIPKYIIIEPIISEEFQVVYDANLMGLITTQLANYPNTISSHARSRLVRDHIYLLSKHRASIESVFKIFKYFEYEEDPEVWNTFINYVLAAYRPYLQLYGTAKSRLKNFLGSIIDKALVRQGIDSVDILLSANVTGLNPTALKAVEACILVSSPTCVRFATQLMQTWKAQPTLNNPFNEYPRTTKFECLALRGSHPTDELSQFFLAQDDSSYCKVVWCTGNDTLILENVVSVFEDGPNLYKEKMCSPVFGFVFKSNVDDDRLDLIEPIYYVMKEAILNRKLLNPSLPAMLWSHWGNSLQSDFHHLGDFIESKTNDGDAVPKDLDDLLERYKHLYNYTSGQMDNSTFNEYKKILEESVSKAKSLRTDSDESISTYTQKVLLLLKEEGF